jgi:hypothetical protein
MLVSIIHISAYEFIHRDIIKFISFNFSHKRIVGF